MYLITNTSMHDSLYIEGVRIGSQKTKKFETLTLRSLTMLKRAKNVSVQFIKNVSDTKDSTTVSNANKQKPAKKTEESSQPAKHTNTEDNVVEDKKD